MFIKKQIYFLVVLVSVLSLVLIQQRVFAVWQGPDVGPGGETSTVLTNPMIDDLNMGGYNITAGGTASFSSGVFSGDLNVNTVDGYTVAELAGISNPVSGDVDFDSNSITDINEINGYTIAEFLGGGGGGDVTNPLSDDLSGQDKYAINKLISCIPAAEGQVCGALEAVANKNSINKAYSVGVYGQTTVGSIGNPSYGVYGLANNWGGTGVLGYALTGIGIGIRGSSASVNGYGGYFDNSAGGIALRVDGDIEFGNARLIQTSGSASTDYVGSEKVAIENAHLTVDGQINAGDGFFTGQHSELYSLTITGATTLEGPVVMEGGLTIDGVLNIGDVEITQDTGGNSVGYTGLDSIFIDESNLSVDGKVSAGDGLYAFGSSELSGDLTVVGHTILEGSTFSDGSVDIEGRLTIDATSPSFFNKSAIVAIANGDGFANNAGVEGIGTVGVYGNGHLVGVYGSSPGYAGIFKGFTATGWNPPDDGDGPEYMPDGGFMSSLFGTDKTLASMDDPGALGVVAAGGWLYNGGFDEAGLGICALSGEEAYNADDDFYNYCQDPGGKNNYAGFFAGDIYVKDGSIQLSDALDTAGENLIYGNVRTAAAGSNFIRLQLNSVDKFKVDADGNLDLIDATYPRIFVGTTAANGGKMEFDHGMQALKFVTAPSHSHDIIFGNSWLTLDSTDKSATFAGDIVLNAEDAILDFDGGGTSGPDCKSGSEGTMYYFSRYDMLCVCNGSGWKSLINDETDNRYCSNTPVGGT
ncbi:hypothetical protein HOC14_03130 [bacterium]|jgi:hypothetical protein|nr:hypothetical protein [bacterium]